LNMPKSSSLEEFYRKAAATLPPGISKEIGHFNVFETEKLFNRETGSRIMPYNRRSYYKISLVEGRNKAEFADKVDAADPNYDKAGPARVRSLVLLRAPGWPLGPGDADAGLASARRAVELHPEFPPNQLALGEALAKTGDANGSRQAYERARDEATTYVANEDREGWLHEANQALQRK